jgi:hypothetical protein
MHISGVTRSEYGACFVVLQNDFGKEFLVPIDKLVQDFRVLWGSRYIELEEFSYYGRPAFRRATHTSKEKAG